MKQLRVTIKAIIEVEDNFTTEDIEVLEEDGAIVIVKLDGDDVGIISVEAENICLH